MDYDRPPTEATRERSHRVHCAPTVLGVPTVPMTSSFAWRTLRAFDLA